MNITGGRASVYSCSDPGELLDNKKGLGQETLKQSVIYPGIITNTLQDIKGIVTKCRYSKYYKCKMF
ncbi:hypothetical protein EHI2019_000676100 [Entamoeba histolytica]